MWITWALIGQGLKDSGGGQRRPYLRSRYRTSVLSSICRMGQFSIPGKVGYDNDHFNCPAGVAIRPDNGDIYISDHCNQRIQVFDSQRHYKVTIGETGVTGSDSKHFQWPYGVAVDANGNVYVADQGNNRVQKCRLSGSSYTCAPFAGVTGAGGSDFRYSNGPIVVAIGPDNFIYVAELAEPCAGV